MNRPFHTWALLLALGLTLGLGPLCPVHADDHGDDPIQSCAYCSHLGSGATLPDVVRVIQTQAGGLEQFTCERDAVPQYEPRDGGPRGPPTTS